MTRASPSLPAAPSGLPGQALRDLYPPDRLARWLCDARQRSLALIDGLDDAQLLGPRLAILNPLLWEIGHLAWFTEKWALRREGRDALRPDADALYDSSAVAHHTRWDLPLPSRADTLAYMKAVLDAVLDRLDTGPLSLEDRYFILLSIFHEDMHGEAFAYTRQTLAYPAPPLGAAPDGHTHAAGPWPGDVTIPAGRFLLGAPPGEPFVFDNEKWAHPVDHAAFAVARALVTQEEFAAFVEAGGYSRREFWSEDGWCWRETAGASHPVYWRRDGRGWQRRHFDRWLPLEPHRPVLHVNWFEADAYCRWAGRRLPTEVEWEVAATDAAACLTTKRRFPWGDAEPGPDHANLDGRLIGCLDVSACAAGDSPGGCRQLVGNVWEWTASEFVPYPGFAPDPYEDYSRPWFGTHKVLRGGCWLTRARLLRNTYRNFYRPDRRDAWAGFRTCAVEP